MGTKSIDTRILDKLAELGGQKHSEDDITFEGTKLVIPERMTAGQAVKTLEAHIAQQEAVTSFSRTFKYRPWDGAAAFNRAVKSLTGTTGIGQAQFSFFGSTPPQMLTINIGVDDTMQVPWGEIFIPLFEGSAYLGSVQDDELGLIFSIRVDAPRKHRSAIEGLFKLIEVELEQRSIYRGRAFDGQEMPEFLDLSGVDPTKVVYSDAVMEQLDANVWALLDHTEVMQDAGLPLKRSVLLHGPYGTGKTLAAFLTAQRAIENGWTFVYCRPGRDNLHDVMATARLYQPSVVFFEDVDVVSDPGEERDGVSRLLDLFDGIQSKGTELMAILTTNHPERIHKGMVRPGRLDAVIEVGALDTPGVMRLLHAVVPTDRLSDDLDAAAIGDSMAGFLPAFVKEAIDRAVRYSIARSGGEITQLVTADFVGAAHGLRPQLEMMNDAVESGHRVTIDDAIAEAVRRTTGEFGIKTSSGELPLVSLVGGNGKTR